MTALMTVTTVKHTAIRNRIRDYLRGLRCGTPYTMGDVYAASGVGPSTEYKRRYREARADLEARGWQFTHSGRVHQVVAVGS